MTGIIKGCPTSALRPRAARVNLFARAGVGQPLTTADAGLRLAFRAKAAVPRTGRAPFFRSIFSVTADPEERTSGTAPQPWLLAALPCQTRAVPDAYAHRKADRLSKTMFAGARTSAVCQRRFASTVRIPKLSCTALQEAAVEGACGVCLALPGHAAWCDALSGSRSFCQNSPFVSSFRWEKFIKTLLTNPR